jgi:hypothetical protein
VDPEVLGHANCFHEDMVGSHHLGAIGIDSGALRVRRLNGIVNVGCRENMVQRLPESDGAVPVRVGVAILQSRNESLR